jgi:hypothetical protein
LNPKPIRSGATDKNKRRKERINNYQPYERGKYRGKKQRESETKREDGVHI